MTQVTLHIDSKKKLAALKTVLEAMDISYITQNLKEELSQQEQHLLEKAESDIATGNLKKFTSHRELLGQ